MTEEPLDVVVYGATGFVGRLTAAYLNEHAPADARIGLGGRSRERLAEVQRRLGGRALDWPLLVADSSDRAALDDMVGRTRMVATTVGPYASYGLPLVAACAESGTHYADLTGEVLFMRESIDRFDDAARRTGARIVHGAGFDSIPSDLGVLMLHEAVRADGAGELTDTTLVVTGMKGGVSGGTVASMRTQMAEVAADAGRRRLVLDPYGLSPDRDGEPDRREPDWPAERDVQGVSYDRDLGQWVAPFVMATVNTRVVRRSNALAGHAYGRRFRYREVMATGSGPVGLAKAAGVTGGLALLAGGMALGPTRSVLGRVLPKPGEGPSEQARNAGYFRIAVHGRTTTGARYVSRVEAQGDPGYAATAVMLGESALSLARDSLPPAAGVLTPATAMGAVLVERLRAAGLVCTTTRP